MVMGVINTSYSWFGFISFYWESLESLEFSRYSAFPIAEWEEAYKQCFKCNTCPGEVIQSKYNSVIW